LTFFNISLTMINFVSSLWCGNISYIHFILNWIFTKCAMFFWIFKNFCYCFIVLVSNLTKMISETFLPFCLPWFL
jgi:hypothetical protein